MNVLQIIIFEIQKHHLKIASYFVDIYRLTQSLHENTVRRNLWKPDSTQLQDLL